MNVKSQTAEARRAFDAKFKNGTELAEHMRKLALRKSQLARLGKLYEREQREG